MRIIRAKDYEDMSRKAANIISSVMTLKPDCVLGLATGSSPVGTYKHLIRRYENGDLDFSRVTSVNLDEYKGLDRENSQSYYYFMRENLFSHVNIRMENTYIPDGTEADSEKACSAYNEILHKVGSVDLQLLGIGHDGHIGFNEPGDFFPPLTHDVVLTEQTRQANKRFFQSIDEVPLRAYTMGVGTVMAARKIVILITGKDKADILRRAFSEPVTPHVPASALQFHHDVTLICDRAAAGI